MALYNLIDPTSGPGKPGPGKPAPSYLRLPDDPIVKGIDVFTDEYLYKGLSEEDTNKFKAYNENLKKRGEVYDPQRKKVVKLHKGKGMGNFLVPMSEVYQAGQFDYAPQMNYPDESLLPGLLKANNLYKDPQTGDVFPMR
jgi:hypothetical protein